MFEPQRRTLEALGGWANLGEPRDTANRILGGSCARSRFDTNLIRRGLIDGVPSRSTGPSTLASANPAA